MREQIIEVKGGHQWRRVELKLQAATESGNTTLLFWIIFPKTISVQQIADLYRRHWSIEVMFQRLESVLDSEIENLGAPKECLEEKIAKHANFAIDHEHRRSEPARDGRQR